MQVTWQAWPHLFFNQWFQGDGTLLPLYQLSKAAQCQYQLEVGYQRSSIDVDAATYLNHGWPWLLTSDLLNLIRLSVGAGEYSTSVLCKLFKPFMRYHDNNIWQDELTDGWNNRTAQNHDALANTVGWWRHNRTITINSTEWPFYRLTCIRQLPPDSPPPSVLENNLWGLAEQGF